MLLGYSFYLFQSFIAQDVDDRDLLVKNLRTFDVPILNLADDSLQKEPFHIPEKVFICLKFHMEMLN